MNIDRRDFIKYSLLAPLQLSLVSCKESSDKNEILETSAESLEKDYLVKNLNIGTIYSIDDTSLTIDTTTITI